MSHTGGVPWIRAICLGSACVAMVFLGRVPSSQADPADGSSVPASSASAPRTSEELRALRDGLPPSVPPSASTGEQLRALKDSLPVSEGGLGTLGPTERLEFLQNAYVRTRGPATLWYWGWNGVFAVTTTASAVGLALFHTGATYYNAQQGLATSGLALVTHALDIPPVLLHGPQEWATRSQEEQVRAYERLLEREAEAERFNRGWLAHVLTFAVNAGAGVYVWRASGQPLQGLFAFGLDEVVGELHILTMPTTATDFLQSYHRGSLLSTQESHSTRASWKPELPQLGLGLSF